MRIKETDRVGAWVRRSTTEEVERVAFGEPGQGEGSKGPKSYEERDCREKSVRRVCLGSLPGQYGHKSLVLEEGQ